MDDREKLDSDGYLALEGLIEPALVDALRRRIDELFAQEGERAGAEFKAEPDARRLANLVDKGEIFERVIAERRVLDCVGHVLGPRFKLSSVNVRSANPRQTAAQPLHCDAGAVADAAGFWVCNTIWMVEDITECNGAVRIVPGSHRSGKLPAEVLADPSAPHPGEIVLTGRAGTVLVMNTHLWHGALPNRSDRPRTALHVFYCRWDKPQQQYQKRLLGEATERRLSPELRRLLALDDPLNDALSSAAEGASGFMK